MSTELVLESGERLALDDEGYLEDWSCWNREVAGAMAAADGLELEGQHWQVLEILRDYYGEYEIAPPMRALLKLLRERSGNQDLASRDLYRLFPQGPAKQACRYAGLPKPVSCV